MSTDWNSRFFSKLCGNLSRFILSRPPITMMILFIAAIAFSFFSLALYIQHNEMIDVKATMVYSKFLGRLGVLTFCLTNYTKQLNHADIQKELKKFGEAEFVNISLPLYPVLTVQGNYTHTNFISEISGVLPYFLLFDEDEHVHSVALHTFLKNAWKPDKCTGDACNHVESCVILQIKKAALPGGELLQSTCDPTLYKSNHSMIYMDQKKAVKKKRSECESGLQMHLNSIPGHDSKVLFNLVEKSKVKYRLHIASYIFFVMLLSMLIFASMKDRPKKEKKVFQSS